MAETKPHDEVFKSIFGNPEHARGLFCTLLPANLVQLAKWDELTLAPSELIGRASGFEGHADLLFKVDIAGRHAFLYLLLEHQSTMDRAMPLRILRTMFLIWDRWHAEHEASAPLPPVFPLVIYNGERHWSASLDLTDMLGVEPAYRALMAEQLLHLRIVVDDLAETSQTEILGRTLLSDAGRFTQLAMKLKRKLDPVALVEELVGAMGSAIRRISVPDLGSIGYYVWGGLPLERLPEVRAIMQEKLDPTDAEKVYTIYEHFRDEGRLLGREEGRQEGRTEALGRSVLAILEARGLDTSAQQRHRIESCIDIEQLEQWLRRAATVASTAAMFDQ